MSQKNNLTPDISNEPKSTKAFVPKLG